MEVLSGNKYDVNEDKSYYIINMTVLRNINFNMTMMHEEMYGSILLA